jgi:hypothetical protein
VLSFIYEAENKKEDFDKNNFGCMFGSVTVVRDGTVLINFDKIA